MKKFGTPIGAAPGNANENVGFVGVGTPVGVRSAPGAVGFDDGLPAERPALGALGLEPTAPGEDLWWEGCCALPGPRGVGGDCPVEEDEDDDEDEDEDEDDELVEVELLLDELVIVTGGVLLVVVVVVVVLGEAAHETATTVVPGGAGGSWVGEGAVTVRVSSWPVTTFLTVTVQTSADAAGKAATDIKARTVPAVMVNTLSFRLLNTLG